MEERVHPIPFRTRKLSSPSPMILHNVMWESRPLSTIAPKPLAATSARGFVFYPPLALWSFSSLSPGCVQSPSAAFTQTRLFGTDCVKIGFLMLTYLSTLRLKNQFFLVSPQKCVFCKFAQHQPVASASAPASLRKATPQPSPDHDLQKARWKAAPQPFHIISVERQGALCRVRCNFIATLRIQKVMQCDSAIFL